MTYYIMQPEIMEEKIRQSEYQTYLENKINGLRCKHCRSPDVPPHASYRRWVYFSNGKCIQLLIQRFRCSSCLKSFSLLPQFVVPYKRYCIFITMSLLSAYQEGLSIHELYRNLGLDRSHIRYLLKQFRQLHLDGILSLEERIPPSDISGFMEIYRMQFGCDFMQIVSVVK